MRRPRQKLQVTTFPFLAVLLCALGSLILLLLVMDRRAKLAARNRVIQEVAARKASHVEQSAEALAKAQAKVHDEWLKQKDLLHQTLLEQQQALHSQLGSLLGDLHAAKEQVGAQKELVRTWQLKLALEATRVEQRRKELDKERAGLSGKDKEETQARIQLQRLTEEVLLLEKNLRDLKAFKNRPSDAFSLIPYRGKHGDNRKPIYVECTRGSIVFHPGRTVMSVDNLTMQQVVDEIQKRAGALAVESSKNPKATNANAYVLFLVRPDGIENYYQAQRALKGFAIDYGYELVEPHWAFDFGDDQVASKQQWYKPPGAGGSKFAGPPHLTSSTPWPQPPGAKSTMGSGNFPSPPGIQGSYQPGSGKPGNGNGGPFVPGSPYAPGSSGSGPGSFSGGPGAGGIGQGSSGQNNAKFGSGSGTGGNFPSGQIDGPGGPGKITPGQPGGVTGPSGTGQPGPTGGTPSVFASLMPPQVGVPKLGAPTLGPPTFGENAGGGSQGKEGNPGFSKNPIKLGFQEIPGAPPSAGTPPVGSASPGGSPGGSNSGVSDSGGAAAGGTPGSGGAPSAGGNPGEPGGGDSLAGGSFGSASADAPGPRQPRPTPLSRLIGNHDFIITIECVPEGVILQPENELYALDPLQRRPVIEQALVSAVDKMIQRRQASVRPGEPRYRPQIRFRVLPNGLRTYYWIYPVLERLKVPMSRENVSD